MLISIHSDNPQKRNLEKVIEILKKDGVIIYPTDSTYAFGCNIHSKKAMKRIYQLKEIDKKNPLTLICHNIKQFQEYTSGIPNPIFKRVHHNIPGPYTFIFKASKLVPKVFLTRRLTIGVRIPDIKIPRELAAMLGNPIVSSSLPLENEERLQQPFEIYEKYKKNVDCVIDADELYVKESAIIDFTEEPPLIIRKGDADLSWVS